MAAFFDGHERLTELLDEVPPEVKEVLARGKQVEGGLRKRLGEIERMRDRAADLTESLRAALDGLQGAASQGGEEMGSRLTGVMEAVQGVTEGLALDAGTVGEAVDGVEAAEGALREELGDAAGSAEQAAQSAAAAVSAAAESAGAAMADLGEAAEATGGELQELAQRVEASHQSLEGGATTLAEGISEVAEACGARAGGAVEALERLSGERQSDLSALAGRLAELSSSRAEEARERLVNEIESPIAEQLDQLPERVGELEQMLAEVADRSRDARERLGGEFNALRERVREGQNLADTVQHVVSELGI